MSLLLAFVLFDSYGNCVISALTITTTSRDKGVLKGLIDDSFIYELKGLDPQHSNELFCWHTFHRPRLDVGFEEVVKGFVVACHELPLLAHNHVGGALLKEASPWAMKEIQKTHFSKV